MSNILITGSSGFVGSFLVEEALRRENLIVYAGIRKTSSKKYLQDSRIKFVTLDFKDLTDLVSKLSEVSFDYIIHNAGVVRALKEETFFEVNAENTKRFLTAIKKVNPNTKVILTSSLAVNGPADLIPEDQLSPYTEVNPVTIYGKSKKKAEAYVASSGLPYLIFRPTAVYGPRDQDIHLLFKSVQKGIAPLIGSKPQKLSFIYVKDLVRVIIDGTLSKHQNKIYLVSDGAVYEGSRFHKLVAQVMGKKPIFPRVPIPLVYVAAAFSELKSRISKRADTLNLDKVYELKGRNYACDISDLKKDYNFAPQYSTIEAIKETAEWYKEHNWL